MKSLIIVLLFLIVHLNAATAQKNGLVLDELTKEPIPYVNIHILGSEQGFTSDTEGFFEIEASPKDTLVFSTVGFETRRIQFSQIEKQVYLTPTTYEIPEVTFVDRGEQKYRIGELKRQFPSFHIFNTSRGIKMRAQFIPFHSKYNDTPYLESIKFLTDSDVKNAKYNVRLFRPGDKGEIGEPLFQKNLIVIASKGAAKTNLDLSQHFIKFPEAGLIVAIEWLDLKENRHDYKYRISGSKKKIKRTSIEPSFSASKNKTEDRIWYYFGKWVAIEENAYPIQIEVNLTN